MIRYSAFVRVLIGIQGIAQVSGELLPQCTFGFVPTQKCDVSPTQCSNGYHCSGRLNPQTGQLDERGMWCCKRYGDGFKCSNGAKPSALCDRANDRSFYCEEEYECVSGIETGIETGTGGWCSCNPSQEYSSTDAYTCPKGQVCVAANTRNGSAGWCC